MKSLILTSAMVVTLATAAFAHDGVESETVAKRMEGMSEISGALKTLGSMAKGAVEFDAVAAQAAVNEVAEQAQAIPVLFEAQVTDPKSEAKPEIWTNWDEFVATAAVLQSAAESAEISDVASIGAAMGAMSGSCKACHSKFRM
ncbi:cytochrome c556 [Pacificibacter maritimus]|uniref:Cytochrome c556 n=1 Tax=Pacificibacter maritimus TaxID=762213 RepID=A0A3N4U7Q3_9RHOB|nr:cytochrome c [Pacificibacter maritimus]RPE63141.1 cytochrome c556 [Pacificibacter maritimus]